jgi:hypothetical protein
LGGNISVDGGESQMIKIEIPTLGPTSRLEAYGDNEERLTGNEVYPVIGKPIEGIRDLIPDEKISTLLREMAGLTKHWDCLPKAKKCVEGLGFGVVVVGSLLVVSGDLKSEYGYLFNPPYEFHAWVVLSRPVKGKPHQIMDLGLPGVIDKGLNTSDEVGPFLVDREPSILIGAPPEWCKYVPVEVIK